MTTNETATTKEATITVELTPREMYHAWLEGAHRGIPYTKNQPVSETRSQDSIGGSFETDIMGAAAELAVSKWSNKCWSGIGGKKFPDTGLGEVRWTKHTGTGKLIVYNYDNDDDILVLTDGSLPFIRLVGWVYGREGKELREKLHKDSKCLAVRREDLHPMGELPEWI